MLSIGLMSGTSMDGIDAALIETDGKVAIKELGAASLHYDPLFKILLKSAEYSVKKCLGNLQAAKDYLPEAIKIYLKDELRIKEELIEEKIKALAVYLHESESSPITFDEIVEHSTKLHAELVKKLLSTTKFTTKDIDVIGYHGQTLFHRPSIKITIQVGNGQWLADLTEITVVNDFRSKDVAFGGQGAPFAPLYHQALAIRDKKYPVAVVNCGGISNVTIITGETDRDVIGFDTGPGNGLLDRLVNQRTEGKECMDTDGRYGSQGAVNKEVLNLLYQKAVMLNGNNYFDIDPPKSLDIGDLQLIPELDRLSLSDAAATLAAFTADTIVNSVQYFENNPPKYWILAGGGWNNPVIVQELKHRLKNKLGENVTIMHASEAGWNSQFMEAQIFAYLATRSLQNLALSVPGTTRVPAPLSGGHAYVSTSGPTSIVNALLEKNPDILLG